MKKFLISFIILILINTIVLAKTPIEIVKISDGDTVQVKTNDGVSFPIRLWGIDCYETYENNRAFKQAYYEKISIEKVIKEGKAAKNYLTKLYSNSNNFSFHFLGMDIYKRPLGVLYFDEVNVNQKMLDEKICKPYIYKKSSK